MIKNLSILTLTIFLVSCASNHYTVIDGEKEVVRVQNGQDFKSKNDGWFVPDARMKEIMDKLNEAKYQKEKATK